ncbi:MAG: T9SS type A sorting domain-containing protein, partial [Bacteroidia bacterium]|nr:T9SS type A sorting domain-containing protein [Bacteroidia bacterium]
GCGFDWDCSSWLYPGAQPNPTLSITKYNGEIYAGGMFFKADNKPIKFLAKWNGATWDSVGTGVNGPVWNFQVINNDLYVMGTFDTVGAIVAHGLAKWNGTQWSDVHSFPLLDPPNLNIVRSIAFYNNELYVGGSFYNGNDINSIAKYDGTNWVNVGNAMQGGMTGIGCMQVYQNELYVAGMFSQAAGNYGNNIQRWNGSQWKDVGGGISGSVNDMKIKNNELYVGGAYLYAGSVPAMCIAKWNGSQWCALEGTFDNAVSSLVFFRDTLYIGCGTTIDGDTVNNIAKWTGGDYVDTCGALGNSLLLEDISSPKLSVFPNPFNNKTTVEFTNPDNSLYKLKISDVTGKIVRTIDNIKNNKIELEKGNLLNGFYIIEVTGEKIFRGKIIIN